MQAVMPKRLPWVFPPLHYLSPIYLFFLIDCFALISTQAVYMQSNPVFCLYISGSRAEQFDDFIV